MLISAIKIIPIEKKITKFRKLIFFNMLYICKENEKKNYNFMLYILKLQLPGVS